MRFYGAIGFIEENVYESRTYVNCCEGQRKTNPTAVVNKKRKEKVERY